MALSFNWRLIQSYLGEMACSFVFGFVVYSANIASTLTKQAASPVISGLAICFSSIALIYTFVDISLAHFNPAITFAAIVFGKISIIQGLFYMIFQFLGFMIAAAVILGCFPGKSSDLLEIIRAKKIDDKVTIGEIICSEIFLTGILVYVAFAVAINAHKKKANIPTTNSEANNAIAEEEKPDYTPFAPLTIGVTIGFLAFLGISTSGGAFNPAVVFAPVLFSGKWKDSWAYWVAEFAGGVGGAAIQYFILSL
ncbi:Aquaporin [Astathelohania contejeani]|uniref:Aquaporin n=1 Tax=Astathelohania contejeani TaxID=164912 RepID=A0ABQ7I022_9MICR|nr:Aquaporin [Thelohania contejeani]